MNTDKLTIAALLILVIALSYRLYKLSSKSPEQPQEEPTDRDTFNFNELGSRLKFTERETGLEKHRD